jgi:pyruvate dehydrogenase E2 component (dihydrolipoyllysine-residue acetyltransferase)
MATNVVMPQMGESIAEGTIVRWIKKLGDQVDRDEPLFEISTDKVDAEIPSPAAGILTDIKAKEGETVPVNSVVAVIGAAADVSSPDTSPAAAPPSTDGGSAPSNRLPEAAVGQPERAQPEARAMRPAGEPRRGEVTSKDDLRRQKSSPLVRRIAKEHDVDIAEIRGTGISGRVTKHDILDYIESGAAKKQAAAPPAPGPAYRPGENVQIVPMSVMRKKIAEHMVLSAHTSPHVYSVYEVNFARVTALRNKRKAEFEAAGAKLTFTAFIAKVAVDALRQFPIVNASATTSCTRRTSIWGLPSPSRTDSLFPSSATRTRRTCSASVAPSTTSHPARDRRS